MRLVLVRHGQSTNNVLAEAVPYAEYVKSRVAEPELTAVGVQQVERLGTFLGDLPQSDHTLSERRATVTERPVTSLYTSPMLRALQTTAPLARALGLAPQVWTEIFEHGGMFTGDPRAGTVVNFSGLGRRAMAVQFPAYKLPSEVGDDGWWWNGYEDLEQCAARARRVSEILYRWAEERSDEVILLVSHGTFLDQLLKALTGAGEHANFHFSHLNTAISRVDFYPDRFIALRYLNRVPHLPRELYTR